VGGERRTVYLHPHHRCAVCDARIVSSARIYMTARCGGGGNPPTPPTREHTQLGSAAEEAEWLPQLMVYVSDEALSETVRALRELRLMRSASCDDDEFVATSVRLGLGHYEALEGLVGKLGARRA
jgi:hypothetical protein